MREYAGDSWSPGPDTKAVAVPNGAGSPLEALPLPIALQMSQSPPAKRWNASGHVSLSLVGPYAGRASGTPSLDTLTAAPSGSGALGFNTHTSPEASPLRWNAIRPLRLDGTLACAAATDHSTTPATTSNAASAMRPAR
jgi:hypothetical protein